MNVPRLFSKSEQVLNHLKEEILAGRFKTGDRIPSDNELSRELSISKNTVREAISALVQQGYIERIQGKGTFVLQRGVPTEQIPSAALFLQAQGHVFANQTHELVRSLQQQGVLPMVFDLDELRQGVRARLDETLIGNVLSRGINCLVTSGHPSWLLEYCQKNQTSMPNTVIINESGGNPLPMTKYILVDWAAGTRIGAQHLAELGHVDILFVIHRNPSQNLSGVESRYEAALRGYREGLAKAGLSGREAFHFFDAPLDTPEERRKLERLLTSPNRPTAIFAYADYHAKLIADIARTLHLRIPEDLSVLGFFNTPWVDMLETPLSSISIREDEVAHIAAQKLVEGLTQTHGEYEETVIIQPELVSRASCARRS